MKIFIIMLIAFTFNLQAEMLSNEEILIVKNVFVREEIDLDSKSIKGWIRLFNSDDKLNKYEIYVNPEEKRNIILYLTELYTLDYLKHSKEIK